jgi:tryptophan synthase beta chain
MTFQQAETLRAGPDERGHFGTFGGRFVPETLMPLILELEFAYAEARKDPAFQQEMESYLTNYVGRPSPLYFAERMTEHLKGAKIYLKRDELNHTGAHKVNNVLGQIMIARRMGKKRIIAETAPACTALLPPHSAPVFDSNVSSTWARSMWSGRRLTFFA